MKSIIKKWFEYAKADLEGAEILAKNPKSSYSYQLAVLHCHQAIEKLLKTVIIANSDEPKRIHNLLALASDAKIEFSESQQLYIEELNPYYQPSRYPDLPLKGPILKFDKKAIFYHLEKTKELFQWIVKKYNLKK
ncbi:HEPN domain protein [bacterium BMS3Abin15]|nr:HEPN domain protein [bacterium BMS3Abin15]HDH31160.1 HEPN domain-containing protein [Candidatus Wolfebacteria bacterium]